MTTGAVSCPFDLISSRLTLDTLRRLQGRFEVALCDAREIRSKCESVAELIAATEVVHLYEEAICRCRAARLDKMSQRGKRGRRTPVARPAPRASDSPIPLAFQLAFRDCYRAASIVRDEGVAGVKPPPSMGQGRPAFQGAGRAAGAAAPADDQRAVSVKSAPHPASPSFCSQNEGISGQSDKEGDIHYAQ